MSSKLFLVSALSLLFTVQSAATSKQTTALQAAAQISVEASKMASGVSAEEAELRLADALAQAEMPLGALKQFEKIISAGKKHSQYDKAILALSQLAGNKDTDLLVSQLLMRIYERDPTAFNALEPHRHQHINFILANRLFRIGKTTEARALAESVGPKHIKYPAARYLLGLDNLNLKVGSDKAKSYPEAIARFEEVRKAIPESESKLELLMLRNLATLGIARASYEQGYALAEDDPNRRALSKKAIEMYREIPRFSEAWDDALFEMGWAYTIAEDYGDALGAIRSLAHPYFTNAYYPEAEILSAIVYWYNCQWDRANRALKTWNNKYLPIEKSLKDGIAYRQMNKEWNDLNGFPTLLGERIKKDPQYNVFETLITSMVREQETINKDTLFKSSPLGSQLNEYYSRATAELRKTARSWTDQTLKDLLAELQNIQTRASIISLETKTAETQWLDEGRQIIGIKRSRLARPYVPVDRDQFWWVTNTESWKDELGFYRLSVKSECYE